MAHSSSPFSDYLADSESSGLGDYLSNSESSGLDNYLSDSSLPTMKTSYKPNKSRRVVVRSPSEEDFFQKDRQLDYLHRTPTPYAILRHSSDSDNTQRHNKKERTTEEPDKKSSVAANNPTTAVPGVQPYNNPTGSTSHLGSNSVYVHGGQPFVISPAQPNTPYFQAVNFAGQPAPIFVANGAATTANMPEPLGGYQNSAPATCGQHFQPQTPDTTFGPIHHQYVPRFDAGGAFVGQPGIAPAGVAVPAVQAHTTPFFPVPIYAQQPGPAQPMMYGGGSVPAGAPVMMAGGVGGGVPPGQPMFVNGGPAPMMPGTYAPPAYNPIHNEPATGIGQTAGEVAAAFMMNPELNEPQDFKPADDNPSRMYMVRQLDGQYIQMSRATIDSFGNNGARWYCTDDGVFYAVRLDG